MKHVIHLLSLGAMLATMVIGAAAQGKSKTLVYCSEGSPSTFNPQIATDGPTFVASGNTVYDRLVQFERGGTKVLPSLAESWEISKDGKIFTFKLRKGVKFHKTKYFTPSRDFNAEDVIFTFNRQRVKSHPYHKISGGNYEYFHGMGMDKLLKDLVKVDEYTVRFELSEPSTPFLANLGMHFASILSSEYGKKLLDEGKPERIDTHPVGTGPFKFRRYVKDTTIRFEKNESYFLGASPLDKLVFVITPDASVRTQKLRTGECHVVTLPAPSDLALMKKDPKINLMQKAGLNVGYVAFNVGKRPFDNVLVRRAINHALNRREYIKAIYLGHAEVAKNPIPPTMWSYNDKVRDYAYDIKKAKELLSKAGFPNGFSTELWTLPVSRPYNPEGKKMGEFIQADLAKIGVKVKLVSYDWPTYLKKSAKGEHTMLQLGWSGDNGDPDNFLHILLGCSGVEAGSNTARWCNKKFNEMVNEARRVSDVKKRTRLYLQAQQIFKEEAPWVTIAHAKVYRATTKKVKGFKISSLTGDYFYGVDLQ